MPHDDFIHIIFNICYMYIIYIYFIYIYSGMITKIKVINTTSHHIANSFLVCKTVSDLLSEILSTILLSLTIVTMLHIQFPELILHISESLYPLTCIYLPVSPFRLPLATIILFFVSLKLFFFSFFSNCTYK